MARKIAEVTTEEQMELIPKNQRNLFWHSTLFNEVYLENDVPVFHKDVWVEDEVEFETFLNQFRNFAETLDGEKPQLWSERTTINRFIKPILEMLGYTSASNPKIEPWVEDEPFSFQEPDGLKTYKPDFIVVNDHKELKYIEEKKGQKKLEEAKASQFLLPIEAKYWDRIEEYRQNKKEDSKRADKKDTTDSTKAMDFDDQCLKYMEMLNKPYGILTDGKTWRLYNLSVSTPNYKPYFQFNLGNMLKHVQNSDFLKSTSDYKLFVDEIKYFYFIFRKKSIYNEDGSEPFVDELLNYSKKYVSRVEEDLKDRFVNAMSIACNGFQRASGESNSKIDLDLVRNVSESHIFNILFLKYCEARNILPIKQDPEGYRVISISNMLDRLDGFEPEREVDNLNFPLLKRRFADINYSPTGTQLYDRLLKLTKIVQDGNKDEFQGFTIKGFKESIFSKEEWKFVSTNKLNNQEMVRILFELGYSQSDIKGRKFQQIPYNSFSPRQLGSIYESFLEFKLDRAQEDMAFIKKQWSPANLKSDKVKALDVPKVKKGELFFTPNNSDRKVTGSYYTPDCVVQYIVKETLDSLVYGKKSKEILGMKICDPAMGSAHFLSATLNYLSKKYLEALDAELNDDISVSYASVKKEVLHNCIYGADINPRAVKLAKMSLWLESALASESLEDLDDQIKCTNSLVDEDLWKKEWKFLSKGIDAVVGNPPYLGEKGHKEIFQPISNSWLGKRFYQGKMDLFYFFFHLGIDILKENGRLGYITTNYFTTAHGGKELRTDFQKRTNLDKLINLNELKVFGEATGQHNMITILTKSETKTSTQVIVSDESGSCKPEILNSIINGSNKKTSYKNCNAKDLYDGDEKYIRVGTGSGDTSLKDSTSFESVINKIKNSEHKLAEVFDVEVGLHTGADKVSNKHLNTYTVKAEKGDGIFVLNKEELKSLNLTKSEMTRIQPLYKNSDISKFTSSKKPELWFIDIAFPRDKDLNIKKDYPNIYNHLKKFEPILKGRKSTANGMLNAIRDGIWWTIAARKQLDYTKPKIVSPQRSKLNTFGYNEVPWYASCDVYFITSNEKSHLDLRYVLGLMNSKLYFCWLYFRGKRKGEALELYQKPLSEVPLKDVDIKVQNEVVKLVNVLVQGHDEKVWNKLNQAIYDAHGISKAEIAAIEHLYELKSSALTDEIDPENEEDAA